MKIRFMTLFAIVSVTSVGFVGDVLADYDSCVDTLGENVENCFELTVEQVCASPEADCWVECFNDPDVGTCEEWEECIVGSCGPLPEIGPVLSDGMWNPEVIGANGYTNLTFSVCDANNDLSGGAIYTWIAGTTAPFLENVLYWDDFEGGAPNAADCEAPQLVSIGVDFTGLGLGTYCCDVEATDGEGNLSNMLEGLCLEISESADDDDADDDSEDDDTDDDADDDSEDDDAGDDDNSGDDDGGNGDDDVSDGDSGGSDDGGGDSGSCGC